MFIIIPIITIYCIYSIYQWLFPAPRVSLSTPRWVLITGCDTGFGASLATRLHTLGYHVVAACLTESAVTAFRAQQSPRLLSIQLDVTKDADIQAAEQFLQERVPVLHALVNNAGIADGWLCDTNPMSLYRRVADVNLFGGIAMTKMCVPFLIAGDQSRVVNVTSMAGLIAMAGASAYHVSKYGMEAFSDSFRREMKIFGLKVSLIEPAFMATPMVLNVDANLTRQWDSFPEQAKQRWGRGYFDSQRTATVASLLQTTEHPDKAVNDIVDAVTSTQPRIRYRPGWGAKCLFPLTMMPGAVQDWVYHNLINRGNLKPAALAQLANTAQNKQG